MNHINGLLHRNCLTFMSDLDSNPRHTVADAARRYFRIQRCAFGSRANRSNNSKMSLLPLLGDVE